MPIIYQPADECVLTVNGQSAEKYVRIVCDGDKARLLVGLLCSVHTKVTQQALVNPGLAMKLVQQSPGLAVCFVEFWSVGGRDVEEALVQLGEQRRYVVESAMQGMRAVPVQISVRKST